MGRLFFEGRAEIHLLRIGRTLLVGIPGDVGTEIGLGWKATARDAGNDALVIGFANGYIGYVMPTSYYDKPIYEARMAFHGPYVADYLDRFVRPFLLADYGDR